MTGIERARCYCALIGQAQDRMAKGAEMAFSTNRKQPAACRRMLRYVAIIRWLYARALMADAKTALLFRASCLGLAWPYGGLDGGDTAFFRLMATGEYEDVTAEFAAPEELRT